MLRPRAHRGRKCITPATRARGCFNNGEKTHQMIHYTPIKTDARGEKQTREGGENGPSRPIIQKWLRLLTFLDRMKNLCTHHDQPYTTERKKPFRASGHSKMKGGPHEDTPNCRKDGVITNPPHKATEPPKHICSELSDQN